MFWPESMRQDVLLDATVVRRKHLKDPTGQSLSYPETPISLN